MPIIFFIVLIYFFFFMYFRYCASSYLAEKISYNFRKLYFESLLTKEYGLNHINSLTIEQILEARETFLPIFNLMVEKYRI